MAAREREHDVDAVRAQHLDREPAAVRLHPCYLAGVGTDAKKRVSASIQYSGFSNCGE
jgi:hypothetical protein